ncbi:MAG: ABC-2 type transport system permease protein [Paraglaciecola sp.]|jgi:ABC-2 type transport system permease protein
MNLHRFMHLLNARNKELLRDPATWIWNIIFPIFLMVGLALLVTDETQSQFKIGVVDQPQKNIETLLQKSLFEMIPYDDKDEALAKLMRHQLDLVITGGDNLKYWINDSAPRSLLAEQIMFSQSQDFGFTRTELSGQKIRYLDWVVSGVLGITIMHACFFGVGFVIVRYRKNGVLKRFQITPMYAKEFLASHVCARLLWLCVTIPCMFFCLDLVFDFYMQGSYLVLFILLLVGALSLLSLALLVASRTQSEESVIGYLNLLTWPMVFLSGVWFSMEGAPEVVQRIAQLFPLTHILSASRAVMLEGAGFADIWQQIVILSILSLVIFIMASKRFKW